MLIVSQTHSSPAVKSHSHQEERKVSHILECISDTKENQFSLPQPDEEMDLLKRDQIQFRKQEEELPRSNDVPLFTQIGSLDTVAPSSILFTDPSSLTQPLMTGSDLKSLIETIIREAVRDNLAKIAERLASTLSLN